MKRIGKIVRPERMTLDEMRTRFSVLPEEYQRYYIGGCDYCSEWEREGKSVFTPEEWWQIMDRGENWPGGWVCGQGFVPADAYCEGTYGSPYCNLHPIVYVGTYGTCGACLMEEDMNSNTFPDIMSYDYFIGYDKSEDCLVGCKYILAKYGITNPGNSGEVYQLMKEEGGVLVHYEQAGSVSANYERAIACIDRHLNNGRPIIIGINHSPNQGNNEGATDHFMVITGKGYDASNGQYYYTYADPGRDSAADGCNMESNRLYYNPQTNEFFDTEAGSKNKRFDVTQVRPNDGLNKEETMVQPPKP